MDSNSHSPKSEDLPAPSSGRARRISTGILLPLAIVAIALIAVYLIVRNGVATNSRELPYDQFVTALHNNQIIGDADHPIDLLVEEGSSTLTVTGFRSESTSARPAATHPFRTTISTDFEKELQAMLEARGLAPRILKNSSVASDTIIGFLPIMVFLAILLVLYLLVRQLVRLLVSRSRLHE